jgi:hypothetical protein
MAMLDFEPSEKPPYYCFLTDSEKRTYAFLQSRFSDQGHRYNRNHRVETFQEMLNEIREFCEGPDAWRRYLACGVFWGEDFIASNTLHMKVLLGKSKSSINGAFLKMGVQNLARRELDIAELVAQVPFLKGRAQELRQWVIRRNSESIIAPDTVQPNEPMGSAIDFAWDEFAFSIEPSLPVVPFPDLFQMDPDFCFFSEEPKSFPPENLGKAPEHSPAR